MKKKLGIFLGLIIIVFIILLTFSKTNCSSSEEGLVLAFDIESYNLDLLNEDQQAILNTALAFYNRGSNIQYLSSNLSYNKNLGNLAHELHIIPEDATTDNIVNTDCTTFVYSVFENAFVDNDGNPYKISGLDKGFSTLFINLANPGSSSYNSMIAKYYSTSPSEAKTNDFNILDTDTKEEKADKFITVTGLEPGDIIVERYSDGSGHAYIYLGDDLIINSSQTVNYRRALSYMYDEKHHNYNDFGTIGFLSLKDNLVSTSSGQINKYLFSSSLSRFAVISPLKEIEANNYQISSGATFHKNYRNLIINKLSSKKRAESVNLNDEITYNIKLNNIGATNYTDIIVTDIVPNNTTFVGCNNNCTYNSNTKAIEWNNILVNENSDLLLSYTVKVDDDEEIIGDNIISDNTKINGYKINTINTMVNNTLNSNFQSDIKNSVTNLVNNNKTYNDNIANLIYNELNNNFDYFKDKSANDIINDYFDVVKRCFYESGNNNCNEYENSSGLSQEEFEIVGSESRTGYGLKDTFTLKQSVNKMLVNRFYGGLMMTKDSSEYFIPDMTDNRLIRLTSNDFIVGDILVMYDDDYANEKNTNYDIAEKGIYLYIGDGNFATINDTGKVVIVNEKALEKVTIYYKEKGEEYSSGRYQYVFDNGAQVKNVLSCKVLKLPGEDKYAYFGNDGSQLISDSIRKVYDEQCNTTNNLSCKVDTTTSNSTNYYYNRNGEITDASTYNAECASYYTTNRSRLIDSLTGQNLYFVLRPSYISEFQKYTVTFDSNNKTNKTINQSVYNNERITLNNTFEYDGYKFALWNTKSDGSGKSYANGQTIKINSDLHLYAIWEKELDYKINKYLVDETNKYISKVMPYTTINDYKSNITVGSGYSLDVDYKEINSSRVLYTGGKTKIKKNSNIYREYTNIVIGDINGDGNINSADLLKVRQHLLKIKTLSGIYFLSSDINYDDIINSADLLRIRQHLLGIKPIE